MDWARRIVAAIWDFVVGDDWRLAAGAVGVIGCQALLVTAGVDGLWLGPLAIPMILAVPVRGSLAAYRPPLPPASGADVAPSDPPS